MPTIQIPIRPKQEVPKTNKRKQFEVIKQRQKTPPKIQPKTPEKKIYFLFKTPLAIKDETGEEYKFNTKFFFKDSTSEISIIFSIPHDINNWTEKNISIEQELNE